MLLLDRMLNESILIGDSKITLTFVDDHEAVLVSNTDYTEHTMTKGGMAYIADSAIHLNKLYYSPSNEKWVAKLAIDAPRDKKILREELQYKAPRQKPKDWERTSNTLSLKKKA